MSVSSEARIWSTLTSGLVADALSMPPLGTSPAVRVPGSSARYMSFSGVRGRSSTDASL